MLGISAVQFAWQGEKAARGDRDRQIAFQAAEAALLDAQRDIDTPPRRDLFMHGAIEAFGDACNNRSTDLYLGLCSASSARSAPVWAGGNVFDIERSLSVPYGYFTGQQFQNGVGMMPARLPRYIVERFTRTDGENNTPTVFYRITALGFGARDSTQVMLQVFYRPGGQESQLSKVPKGRFGWREIVNWTEVQSARDKG